MRQFLSNISSQIRSRKKIILSGLAIALLLSLAPFQFALANVFTDVLNAIKNLPISLPTLYVAIPLYVIAGALGTLLTLLTQIMLVFIQATMAIGVTPANQAFVAIGWGTSQGIVNIIFILVLVFIGLATILRLQTYQLQKTLPALLIIALLVNFSGVLVGFVVDIGNLITGVFISKAASFSVLGQALQDIGTAIIDMIKAPGAEIFSKAAALIIQILVQIVYFVVAALIIFTVMLLFFMRTIMLWILAILAPIAFAAYILPATKKYWTQWLQQLIQWAIIGIPISFFLYLSSVLLQNLSSITALNSTFPSTGDLAPLSAVITALTGNFAVLLMLMIGITLSMQLAPAGAQGIIKMGRKAGIGLGLWAGSNTWRKFGGKLEKMGAGIRQKGQTMETSAQEKMQTAGLGLGAKAWAGISKFAIAKPTRTLGSLLEMGTGEVNKRTSEKIRRVMGEGEKATQGKSYQEASTLMQRELAKPAFKDWDRVAGYANGIIKNGNSEDLVKDIESGRFNMDNMAKVYKESKMGGSPFRRPIEKALLKYALDEVDETTGTVITPNKLGVSKEHQKELLEKITGEDIAKDIIAPQNLDLKNPDPAAKAQAERLIEQMVLKGSHELVPQLLKRSSLEQRQAIQKLFQEQGAEWFIENNREDILLYMASNAAEGLGILPMEGAETKEKIKDMKRKTMPGYLPRPEEDKTLLQGKITSIEAKLTRIRGEIATQQTEITNLSGGRPTSTPGSPSVSRPDRERVQTLTDNIRKSEEKIQESEEELKEARENLAKTIKEETDATTKKAKKVHKGPDELIGGT